MFKKMNYAISHLEGFASTWWDKIKEGFDEYKFYYKLE